jgi:hypothetical protein
MNGDVLIIKLQSFLRSLSHSYSTLLLHCTYVDDGCLAHHSFKTSDSSFLMTQRKHNSSFRVDSEVRLGS